MDKKGTTNEEDLLKRIRTELGLHLDGSQDDPMEGKNEDKLGEDRVKMEMNKIKDQLKGMIMTNEGRIRKIEDNEISKNSKTMSKKAVGEIISMQGQEYESLKNDLVKKMVELDNQIRENANNIDMAQGDVLRFHNRIGDISTDAHKALRQATHNKATLNREMQKQRITQEKLNANEMRLQRMELNTEANRDITQKILLHMKNITEDTEEHAYIAIKTRDEWKDFRANALEDVKIKFELLEYKCAKVFKDLLPVTIEGHAPIYFESPTEGIVKRTANIMSEIAAIKNMIKEMQEDKAEKEAMLKNSITDRTEETYQKALNAMNTEAQKWEGKLELINKGCWRMDGDLSKHISDTASEVQKLWGEITTLKTKQKNAQDSIEFMSNGLARRLQEAENNIWGINENQRIITECFGGVEGLKGLMANLTENQIKQKEVLDNLLKDKENTKNVCEHMLRRMGETETAAKAAWEKVEANNDKTHKVKTRGLDNIPPKLAHIKNLIPVEHINYRNILEIWKETNSTRKEAPTPYPPAPEGWCTLCAASDILFAKEHSSSCFYRNMNP